jgi:hypothetical protein
MKIGKKYKIESDAMNVTLLERHVSQKTKVEYWATIGYYSTPANALKAPVDLKVNETGLKDLKVVVERIEELKKLINGLNLSRDSLQSKSSPLKKKSNDNLPSRKAGVKK